MKKIEPIKCVALENPLMCRLLDTFFANKISEIIGTVNEQQELLEIIKLYGLQPAELRDKLRFAEKQGWTSEPKAECGHIYGLGDSGVGGFWIISGGKEKFDPVYSRKFSFCPLCGMELI